MERVSQAGAAGLRSGWPAPRLPGQRVASIHERSGVPLDLLGAAHAQVNLVTLLLVAAQCPPARAATRCGPPRGPAGSAAVDRGPGPPAETSQARPAPTSGRVGGCTPRWLDVDARQG